MYAHVGYVVVFFFQAEDGIRDLTVTGVQTCALPILVAAAAIFGILKFEFPSHSGPAHQMAAPDRIGSYVRTVDMEKQTKVNELRAEVIKMSSGEASNVVSAVYESGNSA